MESKDKKAWILPVNFPGDAASAETQTSLLHVAEITKKTVAGTTLTSHLSGPVATIYDLKVQSEEDVKLIEIGTVVSVLLILIIVYRNIITMLVPLATIGLSVGGAQGVL